MRYRTTVVRRYRIHTNRCDRIQRKIVRGCFALLAGLILTGCLDGKASGLAARQDLNQQGDSEIDNLDSGSSSAASANTGSTGRGSQDVELIPFGLLGPIIGSQDVFETACDLSEESFERCL